MLADAPVLRGDTPANTAIQSIRSVVDWPHAEDMRIKFQVNGMPCDAQVFKSACRETKWMERIPPADDPQ